MSQSQISFNKWIKQKKGNPLKHDRNGYKYYDLLPSLYYSNQTYGALNKSWFGFIIAKEHGELDKLEMYAKRIQKLERHLGRDIIDFSDWELNNIN